MAKSQSAQWICILLSLSTFVESKETAEQLQCKPKPGCTLTRCDPILPIRRGEIHPPSDEFSIVCQKEEISSAEGKDVKALQKEFKDLQFRLGMTEKREAEARMELNNRIQNLEREVAELNSKLTSPTTATTTSASHSAPKLGCPQTNLTFPRNKKVEDYVLYNGSSVPQLTDVSICTWLTPPTGEDIGKGALLSYYKYDSNDIYGNTMLIYFRSNSELSIVTNDSWSTFILDDQSVRDRTHFCFMISTVEGKTEIFRNGISLGQKGIYNANIPAGGALVIGNDQNQASDPDAFLGSMYWWDTFTGTIENLYIWSRILRKEEISELHNDPCACPRDHIIALTDANVERHGQTQVSSLRNDCD